MSTLSRLTFPSAASSFAERGNRQIDWDSLAQSVLQEENGDFGCTETEPSSAFDSPDFASAYSSLSEPDSLFTDDDAFESLAIQCATTPDTGDYPPLSFSPSSALGASSSYHSEDQEDRDWQQQTFIGLFHEAASGLELALQDQREMASFLEDEIPSPAVSCIEEEVPGPVEGGMFLETQPVAGPSKLPAARVQPERAAKRKREEQENDVIAEHSDKALRKAKANATSNGPELADYLQSSGGTTEDAKAVVETQASTLPTAVATVRRSKRHKIEALAHPPTPFNLLQPDSVSSTSNVPEPSRPLTPTPTPATSAQPSGPVCNLLNEDGTRCYHPLTMVMSQDKDHANSHTRASPEDRGFRCTYPGCDKSEVQYSTKCNRNKHIFEHHWKYRFPCDVPGCTKDFGREDEIPRHKRTAHG
ncbi:hypothetical protein ONZ51_g6067 [Trametes cubensis]|uniref:C2H2-type domain-containing protein n=1 Tax=Trametes cubensis TaxID=1111947 RepID=A0AAD7TSU2_9APHY|nr:hypothetical protein ONZ51_g6067 [Trametes cubensis]